MVSAFRQAKHTVPACPTKPWRSREGRLDNRPALQRRLLTIPGRPAPEGRGEPSGLEMIRITSFAEKKQPGFAVFRAKHSLRRFTPALRDGGSLFVLSTGAEAPAYYQSASPDFAKALSGRPRRRRFHLARYPPRNPCTSRVRVKDAKQKRRPGLLISNRFAVKHNDLGGRTGQQPDFFRRLRNPSCRRTPDRTTSQEPVHFWHNPYD